MGQSRDVVSLAIVFITLGVILLVAVSIFGTIAERSEPNPTGDREKIIQPATGAFVDVYDSENSFYEERGENPTVHDSRGLSRLFTGAPDSYLASDDSLTVASDQNWTAHQGVWVNQSATNRNMTVLALGDPNVLVRYDGNRSSAVWRLVYVGVTSTNETTVSAPSPTDATQLFIGRSSNTLWINRDNSANATITVSDDSTGQTNLTTAKNLDGRLDETRMFDTRLNSSQRQSLVDDPITPLPGTDRTARIMYDERVVSPVNVFFADGDATVSNATIADGFAGSTLTESSLMTTGDYDWRPKGPEFRLRSGSDVAGAPAVYANYTLVAGGENPVLNGIASALQLSAVLPILLIVSMVLTLLAATRRR